MNTIVIITVAYNAENTLRRAVDSILNQSYQNFVYYVVDNGSTDQTRAIIQEYAKQDSRIIPLYFDKNSLSRYSDMFKLVVEKNKGDFMTTLDSDDEYMPDFFKDALEFSKQTNADIVATGNQFINAENGKYISDRAFQRSVTITGEEFLYIDVYYGFIRTVWGKLLSMETVKKSNLEQLSKYSYGGDTAFCLRCLEQCKKLGILKGTYHKYYVNLHSSSYQWCPNRIETDSFLFHDAVKMLQAKNGKVTLKSIAYLYLVYYNAANGSLNVLLNSKCTESEKLNAVIRICNNYDMHGFAKFDGFSKCFPDAEEIVAARKDFFAKLTQLLMQFEEVPPEKMNEFCDAGIFASAAAENADAWIAFKKFYLQYLIEHKQIEQSKQELTELQQLLPNDEAVEKFAEALQNMSDK